MTANILSLIISLCQVPTMNAGGHFHHARTSQFLCQSELTRCVLNKKSPGDTGALAECVADRQLHIAYPYTSGGLLDNQPDKKEVTKPTSTK